MLTVRMFATSFSISPLVWTLKTLLAQVIIDEGGQAHVAHSIIPLMMGAQYLTVVGDPMQLKPFVHNAEVWSCLLYHFLHECHLCAFFTWVPIDDSATVFFQIGHCCLQACSIIFLFVLEGLLYNACMSRDHNLAFTWVSSIYPVSLSFWWRSFEEARKMHTDIYTPSPRPLRKIRRDGLAQDIWSALRYRQGGYCDADIPVPHASWHCGISFPPLVLRRPPDMLDCPSRQQE